MEQIEAFPERNGIYTIQCEECGDRKDHQPKFARSEPRNIALIGHWDGWQPFGSQNVLVWYSILFKKLSIILGQCFYNDNYN